MPENDQEAVEQIRVRRLKSGMILARDIHSSDGCPLLQAGKELTRKDIERLKRWNKRFVFIERNDDSDEDRRSLAEAS